METLAEIVAGLPAAGAWRVADRAAPGAAVADSRRQRWTRRHGHRHTWREAMLVVAGGGAYGIDGVARAAPPGTLFLFDAGISHDLGYPAGTGTGLYLWVRAVPEHVSCQALATGAADRPWHTVATGLLAGDAPGADLDRTWQLVRDTDGLPPALAQRQLRAAVELALTELARREHHPQTEAPPTDELAVQAVCRHLQATAGRGAGLDDLARLAGYSKYHFLRLFRRHTGLTVQQYVDECRLAKVREMLGAGYAKAEVSRFLGFSCPAAFSRWYRGQGRPWG